MRSEEEINNKILLLLKGDDNSGVYTWQQVKAYMAQLLVWVLDSSK